MTGKILILSIFTLFLTACASSIARGPSFSIHEPIKKDEVLIYVYKPYSNDGVTVCLTLLINEIENGCLDGKGFLKTTLKSGQYTLVLQTNVFMGPRLLEFTKTFEGGNVYYLKYFFSSDGVPTGTLAKKYIRMGLSEGHHIIIQRNEIDALKTLSGLAESI